ncbi:MAG: acetylornithine/succinylornithine family transaminase [bacterium]|nr:acetylornithine/succinylornithine family transaminase [bacterium]
MKNYSMGFYPKRDLLIVRGKGARLVDDKGNEYIDCVAGHGVANVGHCNEQVIRAIARQSEQLITCPGTFYNDTRARLLEKLVGIAPGGLNRVFLCNSGTEAVEAAIKFARVSTGKPEFICAMKGFHGRTMGALSATFNPKYKKDFQPLVPGFHFVPFNNFAKLAEAVNENTAGIILEPVQGEGGVHIGDADYFRRVRALCREKNILLIIDEVQTGFCRTGRMFGVEHFGIEPDILCVAKAMAGGLPMGAVLCGEHIRVPMGSHGSTFGGNPPACAAALAAIDFMIENNLAEQAAEKGNYLINQLKKIKSDKIRDVRGLGLMVGIELKEKVKPYISALMEEGVLALPAGSTVLRLLPPLTINYNELDIVVVKISELFQRPC